MATVDECRAALDQFSAKLAGAEGDAGRAARLDRSLSCRIPDLDTTFRGRLRGGALHDITTEPSGDKAQIRLEIGSDDLLALVAGNLDFASSWARGRVKLEASLKDLLTLRKLL